MVALARKVKNEIVESKGRPEGELPPRVDVDDLDKIRCESTYFSKVKYSKSGSSVKSFLDYNDASSLNRYASTELMEIIITQDSTKSVSFRYSTQLLDFLGDVGGF